MNYKLFVFLALTFIGPVWILFSGKIDFTLNYQTANRESAKLAADPQKNPEAIIQLYAARAFNWRGIFATHTWIAIKNKNATNYIVMQVIGWRLFHNLPPLMIQNDIPDRYWFNQKPELVYDLRGEKAEQLIPRIIEAAKKYPDATSYETWPGPNSNTFPAYIARSVPELGMAIPANAIGKDYLPSFTFFTRAPSNTGYQFSILGLFGILIAKKEGLEINILGLVYGINPLNFSIKLPGIGEIGILHSDKP